jgi:hypothetical protein
MHQINGSTAVEGHFVDGNPSQQGTIVTADWLNTVQDEICNLIISSGIELNKADNDDKKQLANAIGRIIQNAVANLASKNDLNNYLKSSDVGNNQYIKWCITWIEQMGSTKYPNLPK